ncbi:MAG TPA: hypothetical protein VK745_25200 [Polyangiaceae bacterium]|jgi:hypothetical protein|nr:hypothetical protein [Polyangiaceae bacterium]
MSDVRSGIAVGAALARERLRGVTPLLVLALSGCAVYALAVLERQSSPDSAADSALAGPVFGFALPILAYLVSERVCNGERLDRSVDTVARHGADRRHALLGALLVSALVMAFAGTLLTLLALLGAHSLHDADLARDLATSAAIAFVTGAVYALAFGAASSFGKRGGGRKWALVLDFMLGAGDSLLAAPWPRGHARNLLGGVPVLELSQSGAWLALAAIALLSVAFSVSRTPG